MPLERTIRSAKKRIVELTYLASQGEVSVNDVLHEYDLTINWDDRDDNKWHGGWLFIDRVWNE